MYIYIYCFYLPLLYLHADEYIHRLIDEYSHAPPQPACHDRCKVRTEQAKTKQTHIKKKTEGN